MIFPAAEFAVTIQNITLFLGLNDVEDQLNIDLKNRKKNLA